MILRWAVSDNNRSVLVAGRLVGIDFGAEPVAFGSIEGLPYHKQAEELAENNRTKELADCSLSWVSVDHMQARLGSSAGVYLFHMLGQVFDNADLVLMVAADSGQMVIG